MAVLRGGGVATGAYADRADVKSANNGELWAARQSLREYREAKKLLMDSTDRISQITSAFGEELKWWISHFEARLVKVFV
jgi:hypothetical protein